MLAGWHPTLRLPTRHSSTSHRGSIGTVAFVFAYAVASASCTAVILLTVVAQALASTKVSGVLLGVRRVLTSTESPAPSSPSPVATCSSTGSHSCRRTTPSTNLLTGVVGAVSVWIDGHQLAVATTAIVLVLGRYRGKPHRP